MLSRVNAIFTPQNKKQIAYMSSIHTGLDPSNLTRKSYVFKFACEHGNLELAQHLHHTYYIHFHWLFNNKSMNVCFYDACLNGHVHVAQWILETRPALNIVDYAKQWSCFFYVCIRGHLKMAKFLFQLMPDSDVSDDSLHFYNACFIGDLEMAKWILHVNPETNVFLHNHAIFHNACYNNNINSRNFWVGYNLGFDRDIINQREVAEWLTSLYPDTYKIIDATCHPILYKIHHAVSYSKTEVRPLETCSVCQECDCDVTTSCNHSFCKTCIETWINHSLDATCPYCRADLDCNQFTRLVQT